MYVDIKYTVWERYFYDIGDKELDKEFFYSLIQECEKLEIKDLHEFESILHNLGVEETTNSDVETLWDTMTRIYKGDCSNSVTFEIYDEHDTLIYND